jgi:AAA+ superfamily predicted ATPase
MILFLASSNLVSFFLLLCPWVIWANVLETLNKTSFGDVVIDPVVIKTLRSIISLPLLHPHHFSAGLLATESLSGILLYGPPGTGKTMVCRALAQEFNVPMLYVRASDIIRCYVGESETRVRAVFVSHQLLTSSLIQLQILFRVSLNVLLLVLCSLTKRTRCSVLGSQVIMMMW